MLDFGPSSSHGAFRLLLQDLLELCIRHISDISEFLMVRTVPAVCLDWTVFHVLSVCFNQLTLRITCGLQVCVLRYLFEKADSAKLASFAVSKLGVSADKPESVLRLKTIQHFVYVSFCWLRCIAVSDDVALEPLGSLATSHPLLCFDGCSPLYPQVLTGLLQLQRHVP
jgi:hypothetical protein